MAMSEIHDVIGCLLSLKALISSASYELPPLNVAHQFHIHVADSALMKLLVTQIAAPQCSYDEKNIYRRVRTALEIYCPAQCPNDGDPRYLLGPISIAANDLTELIPVSQRRAYHTFRLRSSLVLAYSGFMPNQFEDLSVTVYDQPLIYEEIDNPTATSSSSQQSAEALFEGAWTTTRLH